MARVFLKNLLPVLCGALVVLAGTASLEAAVGLREGAEQWSEKQSKTMEKASELSLAGETARANKMLLDLADRDGGGLAAFVIGNMLFKSIPPASYRLHQRALQAYPREPAVALEMAMEQQREGEYTTAIANYRQALQDKEAGHYACLLAECLLRTGQLKNAAEAWDLADHPHNHTAIDQAIYEIHGPLSPVQRRGDIIALIQAGATGKCADLIELDVNFDVDWWNTEIFAAALDADLKLAARQLGKENPSYRHLVLYAKLARQEGKNAEEIRRELTAARLVLGQDAALPESSLLARALCELVARGEAATAAELWQQHAPALRRRLAARDSNALHLLCWLASTTDNRAEIEALDELGWKEWKNPEFAASYVVDRVRAKKIVTPDDPELLAALAAQPEDDYLNGLRLDLAGASAATQDMIVAAIKAEYHQLSVGMGMRDSYTLKGLFQQLRVKLGMPAAREPAKEPGGPWAVPTGGKTPETDPINSGSKT